MKKLAIKGNRKGTTEKREGSCVIAGGVLNLHQISEQIVDGRISSGRLCGEFSTADGMRLLGAGFHNVFREDGMRTGDKFSGLRTMKVIVIDDEEAILRVFRVFFSTFCPDCDVEYISDSEEGLRRIEEVKPDLVLLDIYMPGVSGVEICKKLSEDESLKNVKIVIVSGYLNKYSEELGEFDICARISKPFHFTTLKEVLIPLIFGEKQGGEIND